MGFVKTVTDFESFQLELKNAGGNYVIVGFTAFWCKPCEEMVPIFQQCAAKYPKAVFLNVNIDHSDDIVEQQKVTSVPTFILYKNQTKVDTIWGADSNLEAKIDVFAGSDDKTESEEIVEYMDLAPFVEGLQCFNEFGKHSLEHALCSSNGYLSSIGDDPIISITFKQFVKIHSLKIKASLDQGPKVIKIFVNQSEAVDYDFPYDHLCVEALVLTPQDLEGNPINLRYSKYQNVKYLHIYIPHHDNTQINQITFLGLPK